MIHPRTVILAVATALALGVAASPKAAYADSPSDADMEAAKKAFADGKKAFDTKKYDVAVDKFKESYRLSKNSTLLYNIALALDENKQKDMALFYYRKFLTDAPVEDAQRPTATGRVKALETELGPNAGKTEGGTGTTPTPPDGTGTGTTPDVKPDVKPEVKPPVKIKPAGSYGAADFKHRVVDEAPPGKPLDLTAVVPDDSGFLVTLFFRGAGEAQFTSVAMKWRYNEMVGRIPAAKMAGTSVQYYIEVKEANGAPVTKVGKPASPNLVYLESTASAQFYPDWNPDAAGTTATSGGTKPANLGTGTRPIDDEDPLSHDTNEDPLTGGGRRVADNGGGGGGGGGDDRNPRGGGPSTGGGGFMDVGSSKFKYMKWGTTAVGGALLATSIIFYFRASNSASTLEGEANMTTCVDGNPPPCQFDPFLQDAESTGKSSETIFKVTLGIGLAVTAVAGYYWIKDLRGSGVRRETAPGTTGSKKKKRTFIASPAIGDGVVGGAAAWEW